ncbi:MAG: hypothetical protein GC165_16470 [Armatimonadetes bacterium]|nr:hypothetical protein [Armatimonadota bacterium]
MLIPAVALVLLSHPLDRSPIAIDSFEGKSYRGWRVTGTAFGSGPAHGTLPNQMPVSGYEGEGLVNSYNGGDGSTGSMTSSKFKLQRPYLNFKIGGGNHPRETCIDLIVDGKVVYSTTGKSTTPQDTESLAWATWDVSAYQGKSAQIQILDLNSGGWGHINIDEIVQSDQAQAPSEPLLTTPAEPYTPPVPEPIYRERYRPQFHFSAKHNWLNDPNGLVYFEGDYHLFFQYNPTGIQWGNMHWGHAISPDLVHWRELNPALSPDEHGTNYSGSAAVDVANTTGFGKEPRPPLVAMYTAAGKPFTQCLVYSNDHGRTWTKYSGNPVLPHVVGENRDPRIFWHEPSHKWVMALYLDGDEFAIYGSPDLKSWTELSRLHIPGSSECPELFQIPLEGTDETRWIFYGANYHYLVGTFDGTTFHQEEGPIQGDFGANFYASQTYNGMTDGRRVQIAWMNGPGPMPNMPFNQQMSFPCELKLIQTDDGPRLTRTPVQEIESLRGQGYALAATPIADGESVPVNLHSHQYDVSLSVHLDPGTQTVIQVGTQEVVIDADKKTITSLGRTAPLKLQDGNVDVRLLIDRSSLEVFAEHGLVSLTSYLPTPYRTNDVRILSRGGTSNIVSLQAFELKSAWP